MVNPFKSKADGGSQTPTLSLDWRAFRPILNTIGVQSAETGGALGGTDSLVDHFVFDLTSNRSVVTYSPDITNLNRIFKDVWNPKGIRCMGFIHSHPAYMTSPSWGDKAYAARILAAIPDLEQLWLPIVMTVNDTQTFQLTPWVARRSFFGVRLTRGLVQITNMPPNAGLRLRGVDLYRYIRLDEPMDEIKIPVPQHPILVDTAMPLAYTFTVPTGVSALPVPFTKPNIPPPRTTPEPTLPLAKPAELPLIHKTRLIVFGAGEGAEVLEHLAWAGLGQVILIDLNSGTLSDRLRSINPKIKIRNVLKEPSEMTEKVFRDLLLGPIDGSQAEKTVLGCFTDTVEERDLVSRLAFKYYLPCFIEYAGLTEKKVEIDFQHPGFTPDHQCSVLILPHEYYTQKSRISPALSNGVPKLTPKSLPSIENSLLLSLIHYNTAHPTWGRFLTLICNLNHLRTRSYIHSTICPIPASPVKVTAPRNNPPQIVTTGPQDQEIYKAMSGSRTVGTRINFKT
jgi:hypothetical protein